MLERMKTYHTYLHRLNFFLKKIHRLKGSGAKFAPGLRKYRAGPGGRSYGWELDARFVVL
jgi:hypothetical protein